MIEREFRGQKRVSQLEESSVIKGEWIDWYGRGTVTKGSDSTARSSTIDQTHCDMIDISLLSGSRVKRHIISERNALGARFIDPPS